MRSPNNKPIEIAYKEVRNFQAAFNQGARFLSSDFAYVYHFARLKRIVPFSKGGLYRLTEGRIIHVLKGTATFHVNLITYHLEPGTLLFISSGSLIEICEIDDDIDMRFVLICDAFIQPVTPDDLLTPHLGEKVCVHLPPSQQLAHWLLPSSLCWRMSSKKSPSEEKPCNT